MVQKALIAMSFVLSLFTLGAAQASQTTEASAVFEVVGIWTGDNMNSGAPAPRCACDVDMNVADCAASVSMSLSQGEICYDEYIPAGSGGWVHAQILKAVK